MIQRRVFYALPIFLLALIVMVGVVVTQPANSLTMDINPSIEIVTNRLDRVVEINPLNDDARELLADFNPKDKNLESTVNDLVDLMILTGHIKGGQDNFVMITVADDTVDNKLVDKVNRAIKAMLENKQIEATILNQAIAKADRGDEKRTGVQLAAQRLQEIDGRLTAEQIGSMTVRELIHYSKKNNIPIENLFKVAAGDLKKATETKPMISREDAERIALERVNGEIIKVELDDLHDDDGPEYEIEILSDGVKYEFEIDAYTGEIRELDRDDDDHHDHDDRHDYDDHDDDDRDDDNRDNDRDDDRDDDDNHRRTSVSKSRKQSPKTSKGKISAERAKAIALELTGEGKITELELDDDEYEIEIEAKGKEYDIEIDAYTGKVLNFEVEDDRDDDDHHHHRSASASKSKQQSSKTSKERISADRAKAIALEVTGEGTITKFEMDDDEYELEIKAKGKKYEIEVDAYTGKIIDFEVEDDY